MNEIQALESMIFDDAAVQVYATLLASIALDCGIWVDDGEFVGVGYDFDVVDGHDADDREESSVGFPAFGAAAGVVVGDVSGDLDFDGVGAAVALEGSAAEVGVAFGEAVVDVGVEVDVGHFCFGRPRSM